jgi:hypothetical protein
VKNILKIIFGAVVLLITATLIYISFRSLPQPSAAAQNTVISGLALSPSSKSSISNQTIESSSYPAPNLTPSSTERPTVTLGPTRTPPPIQTDMPPTSEISTPFPTPQFTFIDNSVDNSTLLSLWYPYYPTGNSEGSLQQILLGNDGGRKAMVNSSIKFGFKFNLQLLKNVDSIKLSPNKSFLSVKIFSDVLEWVEIFDLEAKSPLSSLTVNENVRINKFFDWSPDSQSVLVHIDDVGFNTLSTLEIRSGKRINIVYNVSPG